MNQKIAISELLENAGSINDDDLLLLSKKTSENNFKSTKLAGSVFKEIVNGLIDTKSSDFHRVAFPDWDNSKKTEITTNPWTVSGNGWVVISYKNTGNTDNVGIKINNILVAGFFRGENAWQDIQPAIIPVCDGDEITFDTEYSGEITSLLEMYFYPIKLVTEHGIIGNGGSGGVIDGTSFELVNGDSGDKHKKTYNSGKISDISYTVENDCLLYVHTLNNGEQIRYYINENEIYHGSPSDDIKNSCLVPVKSGSTITVGAGADGTDDVTLDVTNAIIFVEYKLNSIAPQIAMPDYSVTPDDITTSVKSNDGYTVTKNGWISVLYTATNSSFDIEINGNTICNITTAFSIDMSLIPVSKNDIVKAVLRPGGSVVYATFNFYPCKAQPQPDCASYVIETGRFNSSTGLPAVSPNTNDSWYRLYSDGWCEQGGYKPTIDSPATESAKVHTYTITLAKSYSDSNYYFNRSIKWRVDNVNVATPYCTGYTTMTNNQITFVMAQNANYHLGSTWKTEGYIY